MNHESSLFAVRKTPLLIIIGACLLWVGCNDGRTTWYEEVRSPDGQWLAMARSQQWGGFGTAYDATTVYLRRLKGSLPPTEVLAFSHEYGTMNLKMEWVTPTHLEVRYGPSERAGDRVGISFQAVKLSNVEISLRDLSNQTTKPPDRP